MTTFDRDTLIRQALTPSAAVTAPEELGDEIYRSVVATPQRRPAFGFVRASLSLAPSPAAVVLLMTMLALLLIGSFIVLSRLPPPPSQLTMHHGGPGRTGVMPGPGPAGDVFLAWEVQRGGAMGVTMMPLVVDGSVLVADDSGTVASLDEITGEEAWSINVGSPILSSPVLFDDLVVVGSIEGVVSAHDTTDGSEHWRFEASGSVSASLAVVDDTIYVGSEEGILHALDATDGRERWQMSVGGPITSGPAVADDVIYVGATGGRFSAIDARSGAVLWSVELGPGGLTTPAVAMGTVYVGLGFDAPEPPHDLVALDVVDGSERWTFASPSGRQVYLGAVGVDLVYAVSDDGSAYGLRPATGDVVWNHETGGRVGALAGLVREALYVSGTDWTVRALDAATGTRLWLVDVEGEPTIPAVLNGRVIVGTTYGKVVAIAGTERPR